MSFSHRIEKANDIDDAPEPATRFDEDDTRIGVYQMMVAAQRSEIELLETENARLRGCIGALEREGLEEPHRGFKNFDAYMDALDRSEGSSFGRRDDGRAENW